MLYTLPEFGYFALPAAFTTGSSIMPNKRNPDSMELTRSRAVTVASYAHCAAGIIQSAPTGYNRDLQDSKEPFLEGVAMTRQTLRVMAKCVAGVRVNPDRLVAGFTPDVYATDEALRLVAGGMPFRDAYHHVKENLGSLAAMDPHEAIAKKTHLGATNGLDFDGYAAAINSVRAQSTARAAALRKVWKNLLRL